MSHHWRQHEIAKLVELWPTADDVELVTTIKRPIGAIRVKGCRLGLPHRKRKAGVQRAARHTPSKAEWIRIATEKAEEAGVNPVAVLAGVQNNGAARARWAAWRATLQSNKNYSVAGVARVSGFHYSAILNAFKQLNLAGAVANHSDHG